MYKSLTKTKHTRACLKRVALANAIIKHYKSSLITVKRHAMVLSFLKTNLVVLVLCVFWCLTLLLVPHGLFD